MTRTSASVLLTLLAVLSPQRSWAQTSAESERLPAIVAEALRVAPGLSAARARAEAAGVEVRVARAPGLPQASAGASYEFGRGDYDPGPNGRALLGALPSGPEGALPLAGQDGDGRSAAQVSVSQLLYAGGQVRAAVAQARAGAVAAQAQLRQAEQGVVLRVVDALTALSAAEARLIAADTAAARFAAEELAARTRFEAGTGTRTDIALAEAEAAGAAGQRATAIADQVAARAALRAIGLMQELERVRLRAPTTPDAVDEAVAAALDTNPQLVAQAALTEAARAALRAQRGRRAPQVRARVGARYAEDQLVTGDEITALTLTAEVEVPLFRGGAINAGIAGARARLRAEEASLREARAGVEAEARAGFARLRAARAALDAASARRDATRLADEGARLEREVGRRSAQDTLRVAALAAEAEARLAAAERAHLLAAYDLRATMGSLLTAVLEPTLAP